MAFGTVGYFEPSSFMQCIFFFLIECHTIHTMYFMIDHSGLCSSEKATKILDFTDCNVARRHFETKYV